LLALGPLSDNRPYCAGWVDVGRLPQARHHRRSGRIRGRAARVTSTASTLAGPTLSASRVHDAELLGRIADGDESALGTLYQVHAPALLGLARRMLRSEAEAEDLLHDVFVEAWRHAARFDAHRGSARAWLMVRCRARALDRLRSPRMQRRTDLCDLERARLPSPQLSADRQSDAHRAMAGLSTLKPAHREIIELAYTGGLSSSEIAARLKIPIGTVKSRTAAALRTLRTTMQAEPGGGR